MLEPKHERLDGPLLTALAETPASERLLCVFVHTREPPAAEEIRKLQSLQIVVPDQPRRIFTATLSPDEVAALSREDWIKSIRLSQRLKVLPGAEAR